MNYETALDLACQVQDNWNTWDDLERGDAIVKLRKHGQSHRSLARIAGCSEGLIRHIEIVGRLPYAWKQLLRDGHSTRKVVAEWRKQHRQVQ